MFALSVAQGPSVVVTSILSVIGSILMHVILASAMVVAAVLIVRTAFRDESHWIEDDERSGEADNHPTNDAERNRRRRTQLRNEELDRILRIAALALGVLVVLGARGAGVSIPSLLGESVGFVSPARFAITSVGIPAVIGLIAALYFTRTLKDGGRVATRVMILLMAMILTLFIDVYANAVGSNGLAVGPAFVPNVAFVVALGIYAITKLKLPE